MYIYSMFEYNSQYILFTKFFMRMICNIPPYYYAHISAVKTNIMHLHILREPRESAVNILLQFYSITTTETCLINNVRYTRKFYLKK